MDTSWAQERLEVIRTLMERSAIYRRALAPIMLMLGLLGVVAAALGVLLSIESPFQFGFYWMSISLVALCGAFALVRSQAIKEKEPFWSPPTRRVAQALAPALLAGAVLGLLGSGLPRLQDCLVGFLPATWMMLYGCAIHAAGFFMPRGIKLFGWIFLIAGAGLGCGLCLPAAPYPLRYGHIVMGVFFGGLHLAYGSYLYFTEKARSNA